MMPETSTESTAIMNVSLLNKQIAFKYPRSAFMKNILISIFKGNDYPIPSLPAFAPHTIFDIGANIGATALYFHAAFPQAQIYCYEPSSGNYRYLQDNTQEIDNIHSFPYGLFDKTEMRSIYHGRDQSAQNSIFKNIETGERSEMIRLVKVTEEISQRNLCQISILKIDTEGCEIPILTEFLVGMADFPIDLIYVEYHAEKDRIEIDRLMSNRFLLRFSKANQLHRGTNVYISRVLVSQNPRLTELEIRRDSVEEMNGRFDQ